MKLIFHPFKKKQNVDDVTTAGNDEYFVFFSVTFVVIVVE
jgi:hypothetical protein